MNGLCRLERHGAHGTFIEHLAVGVLDVGLEGRRISKDHTAVDAPTDNKRTKEGRVGRKECRVRVGLL